MKKPSRALHTYAALAAITFGLFSGVAQAEVTGSAQAFAGYSTTDHGYPNGSSEGATVLFKLPAGDMVGASVTNLEAWGGHTVLAGGRYVHKFENGNSLDSNIAFSDRGIISIASLANATFNVPVLPKKNLILGISAARYDMRKGAVANQVGLQAVYYVESMPLVVQLNAAYSQSEWNGRGGSRGGAALTYGRVGAWTASINGEAGRVNYALVPNPDAVADYSSKSLGVTLNYWLTPQTGISVSGGKISNKYFHREDLTLGVFTEF